ncbi:delta-type opioid receptor-like [Anneissia japonica]|uniref:delta-type opioid receptor-like n=1 Tax=Anneissia japonica TaxID=1529436 RepID=UPI0014258227|nr:delta-type opioid receptor-like [Anneissia japonica]XP_033099839.1 delta-type opioid receptor-like [Anneissia japonica]
MANTTRAAMENHTTELSSLMTTVPADNYTQHVVIVGLTVRFIVGLTGIFANVFVVMMFLWASVHKKSFTHLLLLHQSIIDSIASCLFLVYYTNAAPDGPRGNIFCKTRSSFWLFAFASTYNLVILTIERYIAVVHPVTYKEKTQEKSNKRYLVIPYIIGIAIACHLAVIGNTNNQGKCYFEYRSDASQLASGLIIFFLAWMIPSLILVVCYTYILKGLYYRARRSGTVTSGHGGNNLKMAQRSLTYTLLFVAIAFFLCWTPNYVLYLSYTICQCFDFNSSVAHEITVILDAVNFMINPIIYAFKFNDFKLAVRKFYKEYFEKSNRKHDRNIAEVESTGVASMSKTSTRATVSFIQQDVKNN